MFQKIFKGKYQVTAPKVPLTSFSGRKILRKFNHFHYSFVNSLTLFDFSFHNLKFPIILEKMEFSDFFPEFPEFSLAVCNPVVAPRWLFGSSMENQRRIRGGFAMAP